MNVWIALLRGVNVGGHKKLPMAEFRKVLTGLGLQDVATYIQSGNAVFRAAGKREELVVVIQNAVSDHFEIAADVFVMMRQALNAAIAANPFPLAEKDAKSLHLLYMSETPASYNRPAFQARATKGEEFQLIGNVFYLHTPNGFGRSELAAKAPRLFKVSTTGRNLRSCQKIAELADLI